jgi:hypothetical protein
VKGTIARGEHAVFVFGDAGMPVIFASAECPLWVKSGKAQNEQMLSALPPKADMEADIASASGRSPLD